MHVPSAGSLLAAAGLLPVAMAQLSGWVDGEVNTTMCMWQQLRAAVIRDTVYMDGGYMYWSPGLSDGSYGSAILDENSVGVVYKLSFNKSFNTAQNITALFEEQRKSGDGTANNNAPNYFDGAMLANDDDYFLYGGLLTQTDQNIEPDANEIMEWLGYSYGVEKPQFAPGFQTVKPKNLTRYIAYGGAANVPSENLAFYFSGMRAPDWGEVYYPSGNDSLTASEVADTLITLDMAVQNSETWDNATIPDAIPGRANPELVWVPAGERGILVALGGVLYPEFITAFHASEDPSASEDESPAFMTSINIYDIANRAWYTQNTTGGPGALTRGCAVMQPAKDYSSFNIYWYGGYDGLHPTDQSYFKDDVWVLSLPSFTWTKVASGRSGYGRAGHKCVMPYPDQMMVIGGGPAQTGTGGSCLTNIIELFNVSSVEWLDSYDPTRWSDYTVPSAVYKGIGGDAQGGATATAPSSWGATGLSKVFETAYNTSKITPWYPYSAAATATPIATYTPAPTGNSTGSVPKYLAPLLGVILGLVFVTSLVVGFLLWRRRKLMRKNGGVSIVSTDDNGNRIVSWLNGQRVEKGTTATETTEGAPPLPTSPEPEIAGAQQQHQYPFPEHYDHQKYHIPYEMDNTMVAELPDNYRLPELSETSMSASDIVDRHSRYGTTSPIAGGGNRSMFSFANAGAAVPDHASMVSSNSAAGASNSARGGIPPAPPSSTSHQSSSVAGAVTGAGSISSKLQQQMRPDSSALPPPQTSPSPYSQRYPHQGGYGAAAELPTSYSPTQRGVVQGNQPTQQQQQEEEDSSPRGESGVSAFSERERTHLRNLSDPATVSTMDGTITAASSPPLGSQQQARFPGATTTSPRPIMEEGTLASLAATDGDDTPTAGGTGPRRQTVVVSPPTAGEDGVEGGDYLSARGSNAGEVSPVVGRNVNINKNNMPHGASVVAREEEGAGARPGSRGRRSAFRESTEDI